MTSAMRTARRVTASGTIRQVSPRKPNELPDDLVAKLREARAEFDGVVEEATDLFRSIVVKALKSGSVRQVAKATGLSPTTVQAWKSEQ